MHELIVHVCDLGIVNGDTKENRTLIQFFTDQVDRLSPFPLVIHMPHDERARKLAQRIVDAPGSPESLGQLSGECGASLRTMQRVFIEQVGIPLARWRNQVKMATAVQLLARGKSVTHVAFDLGFESVSAFIFSFRHYFGDSPGQYRLKQTIGNSNSESSIQ
jgi:AraC-like DNA-binding protein